ncbi:MAG: hypothetical protein FIA91_05480 [Geobacter sp.]|nr:hypothetical protein [Geobacter sp.]
MFSDTRFNKHWKQLFIHPGLMLIICLSLAALVLGHGLASAADATLSVTLLGKGGGSVNSSPTGTNPVGIACASGDSNGCSTTFTSGTPVTLTALADWKSVFTGWNACSGTGDCLITINDNTAVSATFAVNGQATVLGHTLTEYGSLQDAYDKVVTDYSTVAAHVYTFIENVTLNRLLTVTFALGKGDMYLTPQGYTTLQGSLTVANGTAIISNLIIK